MNSFLVKYRVGNKTTEEKIMASSAEEARSMMQTHLGWDNPKKNIKIISVKSLHQSLRRLKTKREKGGDSLEY